MQVQLYDGPPLTQNETAVLWTNPHLEITIDRKYSVPAGEIAKLHRIELPREQHAVEVRCRYTGEKFAVSPTIALEMEGQPAHAYKPRVRFEHNAAGVPGCRVRMFDVTNEPGGQKIDFY